MLTQSIFLHKRIEQLATPILMERKIAATEQRILSDALFSTTKLDEEEMILVPRVF